MKPDLILIVINIIVMQKKLLFILFSILGIQMYSQVTYYLDADLDTYGDPNITVVSSTGAPVGYVVNGTDCNDADAMMHPGATEIVGDGIDQNCDGCDLCYVDNDNDNYGNMSMATVNVCGGSCLAANNAAPNHSDCIDNNAQIHPGAIEVVADGIDQNCDYCDVCYVDADNDNYGINTTVVISGLSCATANNAASTYGDCNDADATVYPAATEIVGDGIDQNCDGCDLCYVDNDNDNYGNTSMLTINVCGTTCLAANNAAPNHSDCNDADAQVHPGATEFVADGVDQNCDACDVCYVDADNDNYGTSATVVINGLNCSAATNASPYGSSDCDDNDATIYPSAPEICDGIDNNCEGHVDEGVLNTYYADADLDGYGTFASTIQACAAPMGYASNSMDCDDSKSWVHPFATEVCDNIDNDCDGYVDELLTNKYFHDADGDGFGDVNSINWSCFAPFSYVSDSTDCDDTNPNIFPGATEVINSIDDNCDGMVDNISVGLVERSAKTGIGIYPNPATNQITLQVNDSFLNHVYTITDVQGRVMTSGLIKQNNFSVNLSSLVAGNYIIKITAGKKVIAESFQILEK